jgi:hypothetical protein
MEQDLQKLFKKAIYHPESRLSEYIWLTVLRKKEHELRLRAYGYSSLGIVSLFLGGFSINNLITRSLETGFYDYLSLALRDVHIIIDYWQDYSATLLNSLPVASLGASLFLIFTLFISIRRASSQFKNSLALS